MISTYEIRVDGELRATYSADFCEASSPLLMDGDSTPFQVADAQHCPERAADLLIAWGDNQGCPIVADGETFDWTLIDEDEESEDTADEESEEPVDCPF